jgi:hypothetical protein|tara:strand:+ start:644 stop:805 length:162 start_codon:yes stop_codon:yes gene_type:complete
MIHSEATEFVAAKVIEPDVSFSRILEEASLKISIASDTDESSSKPSGVIEMDL